jgi:hypothetical protein
MKWSGIDKDADQTLRRSDECLLARRSARKDPDIRCVIQ